MKRQKEAINFIFGVLLVFSIALLVIQNIPLMTTGYATSGTTTSNVTIAKYLAIDFSDELSQGIQFGTVNSLPATNINGTENYEGASSGSDYYINISDDGNTPIDLCIKGNAALTNDALDVIGLDNETYSNSTLTNSTDPLLGDEIGLTTSYVKAGDAVAVGSANYYRFWLDIPAAQPSGDYNNTLSFKGVQTTVACGV